MTGPGVDAPSWATVSDPDWNETLTGTLTRAHEGVVSTVDLETGSQVEVMLQREDYLDASGITHGPEMVVLLVGDDAPLTAADAARLARALSEAAEHLERRRALGLAR